MSFDALRYLEQKIRELEYRVTIKLGGILIVGLGAMVALAQLGLLRP